MSIATVGPTEVTFYLPEWVGDLDYWKAHYYQGNHRWAGQVERETLENPVFDHLWEDLKWEECQLCVISPWVKFIIEEEDLEKIPQAIRRLHCMVNDIVMLHMPKG